jgi:hypothetical protein
MIPKIIHYCWFGDKPISDLNRDCLNSWQKKWPDFEIIKWDESNSPMEQPYLKDAFEKKKFGFMIDYVRLHALYNHGGIFLDFDFLAIRSIDICLKHDLFFGLFDGNNVGMGIVGSIPQHDLVRGLLHIYQTFSKWHDIPSTEIATNYIGEKRLELTYSQDAKIAFYATQFFYPYSLGDAYRGSDYKLFIQPETLAVHLWENTWIMPEFRDFWFGQTKRAYNRAFRRIMTKPNQGMLYYKDLAYHTLRLIGIKK